MGLEGWQSHNSAQILASIHICVGSQGERSGRMNRFVHSLVTPVRERRNQNVQEKGHWIPQKDHTQILELSQDFW
jgi:hypothetical protein